MNPQWEESSEGLLVISHQRTLPISGERYAHTARVSCNEMRSARAMWVQVTEPSPSYADL